MILKQWKIVVHLVICVSFLILPYAFDPGGLSFPLFDLSQPHERNVFFSYVAMLGLFYLNFYILIPMLYFPRKTVMYVATVGLLCLVVVNIPRMMSGGFARQQPPPLMDKSLPAGPWQHMNSRMRHHGIPPYTNGIFICTIGIMVTLALRIHNKWTENEEKKLSAEISSLKLQINPHFLFNTLNSLYAFALKEKSATTASSILKLSGIMRYVVTDAAHDFVSLEKEINYIQDYIELQKMRLDKRVRLEYRTEGDLAGKKIAPLTLIPFIENAFKYGVNPDEDSYISILIYVVDGELTLEVNNNKVTIAPDPMMKSGKGIKNTRARLDYLYIGRYKLIIDDQLKVFKVKLTLHL